jgi:hypothetical protein
MFIPVATPVCSDGQPVGGPGRDREHGHRRHRRQQVQPGAGDAGAEPEPADPGQLHHGRDQDEEAGHPESEQHGRRGQQPGYPRGSPPPRMALADRDEQRDKTRGQQGRSRPADLLLGARR